MVTERADTPEQGDAPAPEAQGLLDFTPEGQDTPDLGVVDNAPAAEPTAPTAETAESQAPPAPEAPPVPEEPQTQQSEQVDSQSFTELRDQVRSQQEQLQYYNQLEQRAQIQQQAQQYQQQLQQQGHLPEQASQMAQERVQRAQHSLQLQQDAQGLADFKVGQRNASVHFAKQYGLSLDDLTALESLNTPQDMERKAKELSEVRQLRVENTRLKQQQVPAQSFDDNQPSPAATGNEDQLLDKYIAGERTPEVVAAAERLLNL